MRVSNVKRIILTLLTIITLVPLLSSLWASFQEPQIQGRLELYQTNLVLQAAEYDPNSTASTSPEAIATLVTQLTGADPYGNAITQYQDVLSSSEANLALLQRRVAGSQKSPGQKAIAETRSLIDELHLKLGILYATRQQLPQARQQWQAISAENSTFQTTLQTLESLWLDSQPPASTTSLVTASLETWFQQQNLQQFYRLQGDDLSLAQLQGQIQADAQQAFLKLTVVTILPFSVGLFGLGFLVFLGVQILRKRREALLYIDDHAAWETPWDGETIWQVFIVGFFLIGQIVLPLLLPVVLQTLNLETTAWTVREKALYTLVTYTLMAIAGLMVLAISLKEFRPFPQGWFQVKWLDNWTVWGFGGYMVALPLVLLVSLLNQQIWQGQGGSNPILFLALKAQDQVALTIFFLTASVLAPLFEEIMFRGFLLSSLTRYIPVWGSIILSAFLFAIAHMSLSEVLPLMTLGIILGFVYVKSRNLLAPMLLHSLWNSGTLLSLFILGS
ncbi:CPBP family intramembrane metalloprotease [Synechococcus moorigangaii CMS01]|nr:CPBP family intramembrane metalloprotease [Synechococcus moorigangaii CMS01]